MILEKFNSLAEGKTARIGIGLSEIETHNIKILLGSVQFQRDNGSKIYFFGTEKAVQNLSNHNSYKKNKANLVLNASEEPENAIIKSLKDNTIDAVVRGSLSSNKFLKNVKEGLNVSEINRLALLETFGGYQFFFGPVGIDECNTYETKLEFTKNAIQEIENLGIEPIISILSGGREDDLGRDNRVDETIKTAKKLYDSLKKEHSKLFIFNDNILIESSIEKESNLIIAPDGISGNLIYRTLVHLGGGKAYGAIYMNLNKTIIDTSRVGNLSEIQGALLLALALIQ